MSDAARTIEAIWRIEQARIIAALTRMVRDVGAAEDLAQEALLAALKQWPTQGVPDKPGAWLMQTAKHKALDLMRHGTMRSRKEDDVALVSEREGIDVEALIDAKQEDVGDDMLRLMLMACHPVLSTEARLALTLRLVGGLTTEEIARAFLSTEPTIAQRIVRAKRTLSEARAELELPKGEALTERIASVCEVIYLVFNEGYSATTGDDWLRPALCEDALRLGRVLAGVAQSEPEVHGLVALMELQASRSRARVNSRGEPVLLLEQDRAHWDFVLIERGLRALERAESFGDRGPYALQAAIAACHARARTADATDWPRIAALYEELVVLTGSPVVELNRAVAVSMAFGPAAGLAIVDELQREHGKALAGYHLLPSVRADMLAKLGRIEEARAELERAASMTKNDREREMLRERARSLAKAR